VGTKACPIGISKVFVMERIGFYRVYNDAVGAQKDGAQEKRLAHPMKSSFFALFLSLVMRIFGHKCVPTLVPELFGCSRRTGRGAGWLFRQIQATFKTAGCKSGNGQ
jgi:hypothetical protein